MAHLRSKRHDASARHRSLYYKHLPSGGYASATPGSSEEFDFVKAKAVRTGMSTKPIDGSIINWDDKDLDAKTIADSVEMLNPLVRPYGCGPVAPQDDFVLRTYDRIIEIRNECRFDEHGLAVGDRTFKRCYQQAMRDIARYNLAKDLQAKADAAGIKGVNFVFEYTSEGHLRTDSADGKKFPRIKEAPEDSPSIDGVLRSPAMAVQKAFQYIDDKYWHRYLFPFGCFFYKDPQKTEACWKDWLSGLVPSKSRDAFINPYSVTAADVLYLCNTVGYLERFVFIIGVILWAKEYGCNLLRFYKPKGATNEFRMFVSLERHLHLFGSIHMHRRVLEASKNDVGGNWSEMLDLLDRLETKCGQEFGLQKNSLNAHFENMIVRRMKGACVPLQHVFPKSAKIKDSTR